MEVLPVEAVAPTVGEEGEEGPRTPVVPGGHLQPSRQEPAQNVLAIEGGLKRNGFICSIFFNCLD